MKVGEDSPCLQCRRTTSLLSRVSRSSSLEPPSCAASPSTMDNSHLSTVFSTVRCLKTARRDYRHLKVDNSAGFQAKRMSSPLLIVCPRPPFLRQCHRLRHTQWRFSSAGTSQRNGEGRQIYNMRSLKNLWYARGDVRAWLGVRGRHRISSGILRLL